MISSKALKGLSFALLLVLVGGFTTLANFLIIGAPLMLLGLCVGFTSLGL
ncbi:MAG: hypothetical protein H0W02_13145 [Ktedonobacteraceae bacterium]|nr:hypothetical protein [Ktedonobacteraceae bacterium]